MTVITWILLVFLVLCAAAVEAVARAIVNAAVAGGITE